jgi:cytochrome oxidase assembly protein ShyY1
VTRWLSRRSLALGVVALVLIAGMLVMGLWQLSVFDDRQQRDAAAQLERDPVPLAELIGPDDALPADAVGRPVSVQGRYVVDEQVYVAGLSGHHDTYAVATPLVDQTGSAILVVRGSADRADREAAPPPGGQVSVVGVLEPASPEGGPIDDARVTTGLRIAALVPAFSHDLYSGYVVLRSSDPAESLPAVQPPTPDPSLVAGLRNLAYALQWWLFAGFVAFMWWRIVRDDEASDADSGLPTTVG